MIDIYPIFIPLHIYSLLCAGLSRKIQIKYRRKFVEKSRREYYCNSSTLASANIISNIRSDMYERHLFMVFSYFTHINNLVWIASILLDSTLTEAASVALIPSMALIPSVVLITQKRWQHVIRQHVAQLASRSRRRWGGVEAAVRGANDGRCAPAPRCRRYCACCMTGTHEPPSWASRAAAKGQQPYTLWFQNNNIKIKQKQKIGKLPRCNFWAPQRWAENRMGKKDGGWSARLG